MKGHQQFFGNNFYRDQPEQRKDHKCVQADDTDRLICNINFVDKVMTLTLGQMFKVTF